MNLKTAVDRGPGEGAWRSAMLGGVAGLTIALAAAGAWAQAASKPDAQAQAGMPPTVTVFQAQEDDGSNGSNGSDSSSASDASEGEDCDECDAPAGESSQPLPPAAAGKPWTATLQASGGGGLPFHLELVQAPRGLTLRQEPSADNSSTADCDHCATLSWTPSASDRADSQVQVRVTDSRGGTALRRFTVAVAGGNHLPEIDDIGPLSLTEGQTLLLPITASDVDGDAVTLTLRNLPRGARFDPARGLLTWTPSYDQAGTYKDITVKASDGKHSAERRFDLTVEQGYMKPRLVLPAQTLRLGEPFTLQLAGHMPGGLKQADGAAVALNYYARWLPGGAEIDGKTGMFTWRPSGQHQLGVLRVPVTLEATITPPAGGQPITRSVTRELALNVLKADAPLPQSQPDGQASAAPVPAGSGPALKTQIGGRGLSAGSRIGPTLETHIDQPVRHALEATDGQGNEMLWRVERAMNGKASIEADGATLLFTPKADYEGTASVTLQATSAGQPRRPVTLDVNVRAAPPQTDRPALKTHVDLPVSYALDALDSEGRVLFWRVVDATHGKARIAPDGITLLFTPEAGYAGDASVTVQAEGGDAPSQPLTLDVNVSKARLLALHLALPDGLAPLRVGATLTLNASADFEDEANVPVEPGRYLHLQAIDIAGMGYVGAQTGAADMQDSGVCCWKRTGAKTLHVDDATDRLRFLAPGAALVSAGRKDADGRTVRAVAALNAIVGDSEFSREWPQVIGGVYPATLALPPGGTHQIQVQAYDLGTSALIDAHAARRTVFKGVPASVEEEEDPNTGETIQIVHDAIPAVYSGTRYFSGDERIATVSADGLVTAHAPGKVTVSVVYLGNMLNTDFGAVHQQVIGQQDIALAVANPQVIDSTAADPAQRTVAVSKSTGAIVAAATGETVLIGPGALTQDSSVGIAPIPLAELERVAGLAAPATGVLQALGAFQLDVGRKPSAAPLQLAIPVQGGIAIQPGEEVLFLRKGRVMVESGGQMGQLENQAPWDMTRKMLRDTWWLVDNGTVGVDGLARTAAGAPYGSPGQLYDAVYGSATTSYGGLDYSGQYVVMRRAPGVAGKPMRIQIGSGDWLNFGQLGVTLGGGAKGISIGSDMLGALATAASGLNAGSYHFGVAQFAPIKLPPEATEKAPEETQGKDNTLDVTRQLPHPISPWDKSRAPKQEKTPEKAAVLDVTRQLPQAPYPWGKVSYPQFAKTPDAVSYDEASGTVKLKLAMTDTGPFTGTVIVRIRSWSSDRKDRNIARLDGATLGDTLSITPPPDLALGNTRWQLVREISLDQIDNSGELRTTGEPLTFGSHDARLERTESAPALVAGLTCTGVQFMRRNEVVAEVPLPPPSGGQGGGDGCITAGKVQPLAFADSRLYVGGAGVVYVIDLTNLKRINTITIPDGSNIASLQAASSVLLIGEGGSRASVGHFRLLTLGISPYNADIMSLRLPQLAAAPQGVGGMALGADGRTLVVAVSGAAGASSVWVLDLDSADWRGKTGTIDAPVVAQGDSAGPLAAPLTIAAAPGDPDRYLISSPNGHQAALTLARGPGRKVTQATLRGIDPGQPENATGAGQPESAALTVPDGVQFAINSKDTSSASMTRQCAPCVQGLCRCK